MKLRGQGDSEEKVNPDTDVDKQKGLILDIDSSNNDENEKSDKRDENDEVKGGCEHSIEMEKEQPNERDLEGESCQDTGIEKEETVNTESDNFVSNEKNKNYEQCDNSLDFEKEQQKENELEDKGDNIEEYIDINEEASSEKLQEKANDVTEKDTEELSKDFIERKEQTIEDDNDDVNEADEEDEGEKEENDNEKNYQGIMQDENMGDDGDEAYGNDEETKDTESRSVNQIVNGKEENSEDFDDGDDKQSIREQSTENGCELENSAGNGEEVKSVPEPDKAQLKNQFQLFSKFGDKSSDGSSIKLSQSDKWFKQAGIIRPRGISTTDTGIAFRKVSKKAPRLSFPTWCQYLEEVAATKKRNVNLVKTKLVECGPPGISGGTKVVKP